jgi:hypothetical protein
MTIDMTNNRVPYGLLTDEEKAVLHEHEKAGGRFLYTLTGDFWLDSRIAAPSRAPASPIPSGTYRTVPLPKTQDVIAWDRLPDWVEWVARDESEEIHAYDNNDPYLQGKNDEWLTDNGCYRRIDDFPGIVQIGTCDWTESKQRRPQVRDGGRND